MKRSTPTVLLRATAVVLAAIETPLLLGLWVLCYFAWTDGGAAAGSVVALIALTLTLFIAVIVREIWREA